MPMKRLAPSPVPGQTPFHAAEGAPHIDVPPGREYTPQSTHLKTYRLRKEHIQLINAWYVLHRFVNWSRRSEISIIVSLGEGRRPPGPQKTAGGVKSGQRTQWVK